MVKNPSLTIIVPVYKVEKYIKSCLDSILSQTFRDYEVILVDDGSPDNSGAICDEYASKDERIKVIYKTNGGAGMARNAALDIARGRYITFIDSDDEYGSSTAIEDNMAILKGDTSIDFLQYPHVYIDGERETMHSLSGGIISRQEMLDYMLREKVTGYLWDKIFKAELFKGRRFRPDIYVCEDLDFLIDSIDAVNNVYLSEHGLYRYFRRDNSLIAKKIYSREMDVFRIFRKLLQASSRYPKTDRMAAADFFFITLGLLMRTWAMFGNENEEELKSLEQFVPNSSLLLYGMKSRNRFKLLQIKIMGLETYASMNIMAKRRRMRK